MAIRRNINYINKDFSEYRDQLINYSQTYFPTTYTDFAETSPGMMFIEQAAYVGDVLSFYLDNQIQENFIQYARQSNNLFELAYMFGYKPTVTSLANTDVDFYQIVPSKVSASQYVPDYDYALYVNLNGFDIDTFLHCNDLSYFGKPEDELKKYKKGDKLKVKILEIKKDQQKVRVGLRQTQKDPFEWFKEKKAKDIITVKVVRSDNKGIYVKPEGNEIEFNIKKSQIAISQEDQRPSRWVGGERIDVAISEIDIEKRKVSLSIKLLEEMQNKEAVNKFSSPLSGKNLPFSSLSDKLDKKKDKKK